MHEATFYTFGQYLQILVKFWPTFAILGPIWSCFPKISIIYLILIKAVLSRKCWWNLKDFEFLAQNLRF